MDLQTKAVICSGHLHIQNQQNEHDHGSDQLDLCKKSGYFKTAPRMSTTNLLSDGGYNPLEFRRASRMRRRCLWRGGFTSHAPRVGPSETREKVNSSERPLESSCDEAGSRTASQAKQGIERHRRRDIFMTSRRLGQHGPVWATLSPRVWRRRMFYFGHATEILSADFSDQEGNCQETTHRRGKKASGGTVDWRCRRR